ncbi:MAG: pyridoxamine 5'-phosphate oxidase family protein [Gammaproteobacteria bacterium]|nr:pyridoxamine 5'-phosphate oxidase family protein [Gammaproteobacteria bacterium]
MDVANFSDLRDKFKEITERIVWCTVTTMDGQGRPRSRILHPIWEHEEEGTTGWIATGRESHKARHLEGNPFVSLTYWDPQHEQTIIDCKAEWQDDQPTKGRIWDLLKNTPEPVGYDPIAFWQGGASDPTFGVLKLRPWRLEVWSLEAMAKGEPAQVWRQQVG